MREVDTMPRNRKNQSCCGAESASCCSVESVVTVDERGQMVLPKELRDKAGINPGDKLAVVSFVQNGQVCCISLIKANNFAGMVKDMLGPMINEITQ
jgi:AbrB family looped-hinge helix DNA binding protein